MKNNKHCTIKGMEAKAWISGIPGYGPKYSVSEKCEAGVLHLTYKELHIFIPAKSIRLINIDEGTKESSYSEVKKVSAVPVKHSVGVQWCIHDVEGVAEPTKPNSLVRRLIEKLELVENRTFTSEPLKSGRYSRDVEISERHVQALANGYNAAEKNQFNSMDKTVLVPDDGKMFGGGDCGVVNMIKLKEPSFIKRGLVKHLIKLFDAKYTASTK